MYPCLLRVLLFSAGLSVCLAFPAPAQRIMERLSRGVVAQPKADGSVFVLWRLLADDPEGVGFNLYRVTADADAPFDMGQYGSRPERTAGTERLNEAPLLGATCFLDTAPALHRETAYFVRPVMDGNEGDPGPAFALPANAPPLPCFSIAIQTPAGYTPNDASVGDLDGDGDYEIVLKQEQTPRDNSHRGLTGETRLQAYTRGGTMLWTINLGPNIREGAHYTQFMVFDLDSDGRAEVACKTADGTVDGAGTVIGDAAADHRNADGYVLKGPEYLTVFDGRTGAALATVDYVPPRHPTTPAPTGDELKAVWGDGYGNRCDRFLACVAYLDGKRPSLVMCRGYYTRTVLAAWDWRDGALTQRWVFDSHDDTPGNRAYAGQGNHSVSVADVDDDGRDEIVYGAAVIDDDGTGLYSTGWGHGDALHVTDHVPGNPGLEIYDIQERFDGEGMSMRDARTGGPIFTVPSVRAATEGGDRGEGPGRGNAFNIDPRYPGSECWAAGAGMDGIYAASGEVIVAKRPRRFPANFAVWWDGDLLRELLDQNFIAKWNWETGTLDMLLTAHACMSNNGTKATPAVSVDFWGDWREEVIWRTRDNRELRIYTTTIPTAHRMTTLMHDPQYRLAVAWQNTGYNQPPHPGFYLDESAPLPARPTIAYPPQPDD